MRRNLRHGKDAAADFFYWCDCSVCQGPFDTSVGPGEEKLETRVSALERIDHGIKRLPYERLVEMLSGTVTKGAAIMVPETAVFSGGVPKCLIKYEGKEAGLVSTEKVQLATIMNVVLIDVTHKLPEA